MTAPVMLPAPSEDAKPKTVEWVLDQTRNGFEDDYRAWGRAAAALATEYPDVRDQLVLEAVTARARGRMTRESKRTADGVARVIADMETGQVSAWPDWTDPAKVRIEGERTEKLGQRHIARGRRMQAVADAMDVVGGGVSARDAWIAIGGDPAALDEAEDEATGTDG